MLGNIYGEVNLWGTELAEVKFKLDVDVVARRGGKVFHGILNSTAVGTFVIVQRRTRRARTLTLDLCVFSGRDCDS